MDRFMSDGHQPGPKESDDNDSQNNYDWGLGFRAMFSHMCSFCAPVDRIMAKKEYGL